LGIAAFLNGEAAGADGLHGQPAPAKQQCRDRRYDKTSASYLGFIHIVSLRLWTKHFVNAT
jgi:hypothetical protein